MSQGTCLVVMYHYVRDTAATAFPAIKALAPSLLERQLDWLQARHTVIDVRELVAAVEGRAPLPDRAALLTFDDGFVDHHATVLPIPRGRGLTGVFFLVQNTFGPTPALLPVHKTHFLLAALGAEAFRRAVIAECAAARSIPETDVVLGLEAWETAGDREIKQLLNYELPFEQADQILDALFERHIGEQVSFARDVYLTETMVKEMAGAGMAFGYHTRSHRMLSRLDPRGQRDELSAGVEWIRALTGQSAVAFCYPWGGTRTYTADTVTLLGELGYSLAFNTVRRRAMLEVDGRYELPRLDTRDLPPFAHATRVTSTS